MWPNCRAAGNQGCLISGVRGSREWLVTSSCCLSSFPTIYFDSGASWGWRLKELKKKKKSTYLFLPFQERAATAGGTVLSAAHPLHLPWHQLSATCSTNNPTPKIFINADSQWKWLQIKAESVIIERVLSWTTIKRHLIRGPAKTQF